MFFWGLWHWILVSHYTMRLGKSGPKKIQSTHEWTHPKTLKILRGFLGLTCYYQKFVKIYGKIVVPLISLLKKNSFAWNEKSNQEFSNFKKATCTKPILEVSDFTKTFFLECDASSIGLGVILTQERRPLSFTCKQLCDRNLGKYTYEEEMMVIFHDI